MTSSPSFSTRSEDLPLSRERPVHFIGIGGIGMSALAKVLLANGSRVSGSDERENAQTKELSAKGATVYIGHDGAHVPADSMIIVSTAISENNPERMQAQQLALPIFHRSTLLKELLQGPLTGYQDILGLAGTHGKTTMTGMAGLVLHQAGWDPTIIAGGVMPDLGTNAVIGQSRRIAVAELDESDGSLVQYQPTMTIISNLELDHPDHFPGGLTEIEGIFERYLSNLRPGAKVFFNRACEHTRLLAEKAPSHVECLYLSPMDLPGNLNTEQTYSLKNPRLYDRGAYQAYVYRGQKLMGEIKLTVPGRHNLWNALAVTAAMDQLGLPFEQIEIALSQFQGMGRRFERLGQWHGATLVDDYAHHPTEVRETLRAAKESLKLNQGRLIAVFQPHRYSRLQALWEDFRESFTQADILLITDVYGAGESPIPAFTAEAFANAVNHPQARFCPMGDWSLLRRELEAIANPGDMIISLGAGNITQLLRGLSEQTHP